MLPSPVGTVGERRLYGRVRQFVRIQLGCSVVGEDKGTDYGRIDVVGIREIEGDLASNFEIIGVEVKEEGDKFLNSAGQAKGYSIYANRCYLAQEGRFAQEEVEIARVLGIGLIDVNRDIREVLSSPIHSPSPVWQRKILSRLGQAVCTVCGTIFPDDRVIRGTRSSHLVLSRALDRAGKSGNPLLYYLYDYNTRHKSDTRELVHQRRYVCKDCVQALFNK
jgi:hypothetical protein